MYYEAFEELCAEWRVSPSKVSKATGVATSTLTNWKKGVYTPKIDKLRAIADFFGVPVERITGERIATSAGYTVEEMELIEMWRKLDANQKEAVGSLLKTFMAQKRGSGSPREEVS